MADHNIPGNFHCNLCDIVCSGLENYQQHIEGAKHLKKKRLKSNFSSAPYGTALPEHATVTQPETNKGYHCKICKVNMSGPAAYTTHMMGKKHMKAVKLKNLTEDFFANQNATSLQAAPAESDSMMNQILSIPSTSRVNSNNEAQNSGVQTQSIPSTSSVKSNNEVQNSGQSIPSTSSVKSNNEVQNSGMQSQRSINKEWEMRKDGKLWCIVCNVEIPGEKGKELHFRGKAHMKTMRSMNIVVDTAAQNTSKNQLKKVVDKQCQAENEPETIDNEPFMSKALLQGIFVIPVEENATQILRNFYSVKEDELVNNDAQSTTIIKEHENNTDSKMNEARIKNEISNISDNEDKVVEQMVTEDANHSDRNMEGQESKTKLQLETEEKLKEFALQLKQVEEENERTKTNLKRTVENLMAELGELKESVIKKRKISEKSDDDNSYDLTEDQDLDFFQNDVTDSDSKSQIDSDNEIEFDINDYEGHDLYHDVDISDNEEEESDNDYWF